MRQCLDMECVDWSWVVQSRLRLFQMLFWYFSIIPTPACPQNVYLSDRYKRSGIECTCQSLQFWNASTFPNLAVLCLCHELRLANIHVPILNLKKCLAFDRPPHAMGLSDNIWYNDKNTWTDLQHLKKQRCDYNENHMKAKNRTKT